MRVKMENPNKVLNIVKGNLVQLSELYLPFLLEMQAKKHIQFLNDGRFVINHSNESLQQLFDAIPK